MCQYCAHCKGIVSGIADCDAREPCVMPYSKFELKLEGMNRMLVTHWMPLPEAPEV